MVREAALDALLALYSNAENRGTMREFTERFKSRFLEIPNDVDDSVAVKGVSCFADSLLSLPPLQDLILTYVESFLSA